jgi:adenylate kinase family enzyme
MLSPEDALLHKPQRLLIAGVSGVGKTTLAARVGRMLDIPHTEIDALFHGPGWVPREDFLNDVRLLVSRETWVTEWQYSSARRTLAEKADLLVWLDLPFLTVTFPRVIRRTLKRRLNRETLWNGNIEGPLLTFFTDPEHIVRWAWSTRNKYRTLIPEVESEFPHLTVVRLRSSRDVERWLAQLQKAYADPR